MAAHTTFMHPQGWYRLRYPARWEHLQRDEGRSCGFGPKDRADVGIWITLLPHRLHGAALVNALPRMFADTLGPGRALNVRQDPSLRGTAFKADVARTDPAGFHWIVAEGGVVLLATTTVPAAESATWDPQFDALMRSLHVASADERARHRLSLDLLAILRERYPDQDYQLDPDGVRGSGHVIRVHDLERQVAVDPPRREQILRAFADGLAPDAGPAMGDESWDEAAQRLLPVLKHISYFRDEGPTSWLVRSEWLHAVRITYALRHGSKVRFVHAGDLTRWQQSREDLHARALCNLGDLTWPERLPRRARKAGRVIAIRAGDSFEASRILHPRFHALLRAPLGSPFLAAIPDRDTLLGFTDAPELRKEVARQIARAHDRAPYPITDRIFRVTPDGVAPVLEGDEA